MTASPARAANPYLTTSAGATVGERWPAALHTFGALLLGPLFGSFSAVIGAGNGDVSMAMFGAVLGLGVLVCTVVPLLFSIRTQLANVRRAREALFRGDLNDAAERSRSVVRWVFRADLRTKAFHILGQVAEANAHFAAAADLFERAHESMPALSAGVWRHTAEAIILSHLAIARVACRDHEGADAAVRAATRAYALATGPQDVLSALLTEPALGGQSFVELEGPRDPRALLTLASALVLSARGQGPAALDMIERERAVLARGLLPRERALAEAVEREARAQLGSGPMRSPGVRVECEPWSAQVLEAFEPAAGEGAAARGAARW